MDADPHHGGANHEKQHFGPKEMGQHHQRNISWTYDLYSNVLINMRLSQVDLK